MEVTAEQLKAAGVSEEMLAQLGAQGFKGQAWVLYDTVASASYLVGGLEPNIGQVNAIGSQNPAINAQGEMGFFDQGRTRNAPGVFYTNMDLDGQLSYGMEVWAIYLSTMFPTIRLWLDDGAGGFLSAFHRTTKLAEAILHYSSMAVRLGQEFDQILAPAHKYGSGGHLVSSDLVTNPQNSMPSRQSVLVLPEPIEMPRTQNLSVRVNLSAEALTTIGNNAAPGVGLSMANIAETLVDQGGNNVNIDVRELPYATQVGFIGRRIKRTQYGQVGGGKVQPPPGALNHTG